MRKRRIGAAGAAVVAIVAAAMLYTPQGRVMYADAKRELREWLGLPKQWKRGVNIDTAQHERVACPSGDPVVIVTGGQSNASNAFDKADGDVAPAGTFMFLDGQCYRLRSPVLGTTGTDDSLWPRLGTELRRRTGRDIVFVNGAIGGSQLGDFLDARSNYLQPLLERTRAAAGVGMKPDFVIWIQGETDASTRIDPARYVDQQRRLIERFDRAGATDRSTRWVLFRSTRCLDRANNGPALDAALTDMIAQSSDGRLIAGPLASALDDSYRRDGCHFNSRGRDRLARETAAILTPLIK